MMKVWLAPSARLVRRLSLGAAVSVGFVFFGLTPAEAAKTTLTLGMTVEPTGLDPTIAAPVAIGQVTWQNIFEGLVAIDEAGKVQPQLAKSWEVSPDGLVYTFKLQSGVKFHDGEAFDSAAAKFALDRARGADSVNPQKRFFTSIASIETPDPETLVLRLSAPTGSLLYWLGWPASVMVAPNSAADDKTNPIGTGPFKFVNWAKGDKVELEKNVDYWNKDVSVKLEKVTFRFIADPQAQAAALKSGDVDAIPEFAAPELMSSFDGDAKLATRIGNTELKVVAGMNNDRKPFDDKRVRQALMMAIDRKTVIDGAWSGLGTPIGSHYTPNDPGYVDLTGVLPYDPEKAKALLAEAGYPSGFTFTIKSPQMAYAPRSAQVMQAMLAEIGVTMNIEPTEFPAKWVQDVMKDRAYDMTIVAHAEPLDIDIYARDPYYFNYKNPAFDDLMKRVQETSDPATQAQIYGEAQKVLAEDVPALYLFVMPKLGVWDKKLKGLWDNEPIPSNVLTNVSWED
ncbi:peptide/nickel transport system substrate-binding protein [Rhizobium tibeticum]|uniref:Glutathione-binding protein GsiB n=1 Tax=Rhizobium tibeticum TaxID=501024 RepID=A0A1H8JS85_9HYPH|nr:ABC transporter substrate-binding protein [Rhizobium tibeticum]MDP9807254.1 peptide/nickel transport system substrate-binding protein [Rhizobium tibeticum]SEH79653.1 Glutathione-binding protein GsiB precursor [Rhizobium tibeticum]SEN83570.1 peptide/nickel transport system substrate-binding protein [Rhizobium tibeticum]